MIFLLDMDDTLLDFGKAEEENLRRTLKRAGLPYSEEFRARFHRINDDLWKLLERGEIERERLKRERFEIAFREFSYTADVEEVSRVYYGNFPEICFPYRGAAEFLKELSSLGQVYIVTNGGKEVQHRHIELAGFLPYLSGVFVSEEVGADKPSREYADRVTASIEGFSRGEAVYIGDSPTSDMICAERMGVEFIRFDPALPAEPQYRTILSRFPDRRAK